MFLDASYVSELGTQCLINMKNQNELKYYIIVILQ